MRTASSCPRDSDVSLGRQPIGGAAEKDTGNVAEPDGLDAGRARFRVGEEVTGRVTDIAATPPLIV